MDVAQGVVAALLVVGMIHPCVEREGGVGERLVNLEQGSVECEVEVTDVVANTARDSGTDGVVDLEVSDTAVGIHELERDGYVGNRLTTIVDYTESDSVLFEIDTARAARRTHLGDGDIVVEGRIDADINLRIVTGAVAGAETAEVVERVVEVLRCGVPVGGTIVVARTVVEEFAADSVAMPTDGTVGILCGPEVGVGAIVDHGVVRDGHLGRVVGGDVDVVGGVGKGLKVVFVMDKAAEFDGEVTNIACGEEVGSLPKVRTSALLAPGIFGKLGSVCEPDCCA